MSGEITPYTGNFSIQHDVFVAYNMMIVWQE